MAKKRFSKKQLLIDLADLMEKRRGTFDPKNGWSQVQGKGEQANRDYAEWRAIEMVHRLIKEEYIGH